MLTARAMTRRESAKQTAWLPIPELTVLRLQAAALVIGHSVFIYLLTLGEESLSLEEKWDYIRIYKNMSLGLIFVLGRVVHEIP